MHRTLQPDGWPRPRGMCPKSRIERGIEGLGPYSLLLIGCRQVYAKGVAAVNATCSPARRYAQHLSVPTGRAWRANGLTELQHQKADLSI